MALFLWARFALLAVLAALIAGVAYLGWRVGSAPPRLLKTSLLLHRRRTSLRRR